MSSIDVASSRHIGRAITTRSKFNVGQSGRCCLEETSATSFRQAPKIEIRSSRTKIGFLVVFFAWPYLILVPSLSDPHWRLV